MIARGLALLVPLLALCALWRALAGSESGRTPMGAETASVPAPCGGDDCGCPHEVVPASCCCTPKVRATSMETRADASHVAAAPPARAANSSGGASAAGEPHASLSSFHCSGARRASAEAAPAPPAVADGLRSAELEPEPRSALACVVFGPRLPIDREPATPPPRRCVRA